MADQQEQDKSLFLLPCSICSRTFRCEVLERHQVICEKSLSKKRKVFDSFKCRVQGTDLAEFIGPLPLPGQQQKAPVKSVVKHKVEIEKPKPAKWRQTHETLVATLRAARGEQSASSTTAPINNDHELCPTCGRSFGPRAYGRHVEFCKEMMFRKARTPPKTDAAYSRQQARIQYRAPLSIKRSRPDVTVTKLPATSPASSRPQSLSVAAATPTLVRRAVSTAPPAHRAHTTASHRLPPATAPMHAIRSSPDKTLNLSRLGSTRNSLRLKGVSPAKVPKQAKPCTMDKENSPEQHRTPKLKNVHNESSDSINPLHRTMCKTSMIAITAAADQQMHDLLSWSSDCDIATKARPILFRSPGELPPSRHNTSHATPSPEQVKIIQTQLTPSPKSPLPKILSSPKIASPLLASPTSAFSPVPSSNNNTFLYDENDNSTRWSDNSFDDYNELTSTPKPKPVSRTPASLRKSLPATNVCDLLNNADNRRHSTASATSHSSASTLIDEGILWAQLEAHCSSPASKTKKRNFARSKSVFDDRNRMLYLQTYVPDLSSSEDDIADEFADSHRPRPQHDLRATHRVVSSSKTDNFNGTTSGGDATKEIAVPGGDSAYSSLNRRSPVSQDKITDGQLRKLSTFCHECGCKYPVTSAKFCCQCGIQRLSI